MTVRDGGPWRGPTTEAWVERIARGSTPVREYVDGKFQPWIDPTPPQGRDDLAVPGGTSSRDASALPGSPAEVPSLAPTGADLS